MEDRSEEAASGGADLSDLIDGVRAAGNEVEVETYGAPRPLSPEIHAVAYRTLQEMLTNALKHGRCGGRALVKRAWEEKELFLGVVNPMDPEKPVRQSDQGLGLPGMARRLESVGRP